MAVTTPPPRFATTPGGKPSAQAKGSPVADEKAGAGKKKGIGRTFKSKKFIMILVAVLAVGGIGYKTFAPKKAAPPAGGDVVAVDPTTLNLQGGHYLKVAIAIQLVKGKAAATGFPTSQAAELTINEFSDRSVASLSSNPARQHLVTDLDAKIKAAYPGEVFQVFLTQFVTQ